MGNYEPLAGNKTTQEPDLETLEFPNCLSMYIVQLLEFFNVGYPAEFRQKLEQSFDLGCFIIGQAQENFKGRGLA